MTSRIGPRALLPGLIFSLSMAVAALSGCTSDAPVGEPLAPAEQQKALQEQNDALAKSANKAAKAAGAVPKSIKGNFKGAAPAGQ